MTCDWQTKLRLSVLSVTSLLFLANCQPELLEKAAEPPPLETIKSICLAWFNSQPLWQDSDAEQTKDDIDYSYRVHEATCDRYLKEK